METPLKQRLVGATVLVALGVIFIPMLLEGGKDDARLTVSMEIPPQPRLEFEDRLETPPPVDDDQQPQPLEQAIAPVKQQSSPASTQAGTAFPPSSKSPGPAKDAPKTEKAESLQTAKEAPADNGGQWIVQAGSFSRETNAIAMRDQLKTKGFKAFVENASTSAGPVYRVRIGPVKERDAAEALVKRLNSSGNYHGLVMAYP